MSDLPPPDPATAASADPTLRVDPRESTPELVRLLDQYLAELEEGRSPDRDRMIADHPHLAPQLAQALAGLDFIRQATGPERKTPAQLGDYRIVREVGQGGMGVVYEAEQISLRRRVALKVLRFGAVADEVAMQRFQREAETVAHLHHTNIVPIFSVGSEEGVRYYAMQFIDGCDLAERSRRALEEERPIPARDLAGWGLQAAEALAHAHQRGVIHRDIKPSNLILDAEGRIWLTDFGLARRVDDVALSVAGSILGTPRYMSPEQARASKDPVDHRTDIYSLGATLYELATGQPIFDALTPHEVISQILHVEPRAPRQVAPDVPRDLETVILKCLSKEADRRYASAQALADDLRAFLDGRAISARPPSLPERVLRWTRRHRKTVATATMSAALSLFVVAAGWIGWDQHRRARLGELMIYTKGLNLVAEVLDDAGQAVLPAFPVPTPERVPLPEGAYQVRLSASGLLSETWPVDILRGHLEQPTISLEPRWLWPPRDLHSSALPEMEVAALDGTPDMILLTQATAERSGPRQEQRVQRLDGANGFPLWPRDLVFSETNLPQGRLMAEWRNILWPAGLGTGLEVPRLVRPAPDLDADGTGDLVWASRQHPSLLAVSGADGSVLWWHRSHPSPPDHPEGPAPAFESAWQGALVGQPAVTDMDGDGVSDFLACFTTQGETFKEAGGQRIQSGPQSWVAAVSGRTGAELWRDRVGADWKSYANTSTDFRKFNALCRPRVVRDEGRELIVLCAGATLHGWNARTGEAAWPPQALGFEPLFAPDPIGTDQGGSLLLVRRPPDSASSEALATELRLVNWSLAARAPVWEAAFAPVYPNFAHELDQAIEPFHRVVDLDRDGRPEVLVPVGHQDRWRYIPRVAGLRVLDAATGSPAWESRLLVDYRHTAYRPVDRIQAGPDLDRDGARELFVSWTGYDDAAGKGALFVAAVSGRDGRMLWRWSRAMPGPSLDFQWWQAGVDGWPLLVVPVESGPGGQRMTYFLSSATGRLEHTLPDVSDVRAADFNGDGIEDLHYTVYPQGTARHLVLRGEPPASWRRLGDWSAAADYDRDGFTDLVRLAEGRVSARSGRDGRLLWNSAPSSLQPDLFLAPSAAIGDLDGDGIPDLTGHLREYRPLGPNQNRLVSKLAAVSGRDGSRLWTAEELDWSGGGGSSSGPVWSFSHPQLDAADLDGDGRTEILMVQQTGNTLELNAVAGADGRLLWRLPIIRGGWGLKPSIGARPLGDVNGDGTLDAVVWSKPDAPSQQGDPCLLQAIDGRDGRLLWSAQPLGVATSDRLTWPMPTMGDLDGDGVPEVIVTVHQEYDRKNGYPCDLVVLDGRSGAVRWTWSWTSGFPEVWPPLLLPTGQGGHGICMAIKEHGMARIVTLDSGGTLAGQFPLSASTANRFPRSLPLWRVFHPAPPAPALLTFLNDGHLNAVRGAALEPAWTWRLPDEAAQFVDSGAAGTSRPDEMVVWSGTRVMGLSLTDGHPLWRSSVPLAPVQGNSSPPEVELLASPALDGLPRVQLTWPNRFGLHTASRQAWPASTSGDYVPPVPDAVQPGTVPAVEMSRRPLPWVWDPQWVRAFRAGLLTLGLLAIPAWLMWHARRRRSRGWGVAVTALAGASVWVLPQGVVPVLGVVFAGWTLLGAARRRSIREASWAALYALLSLAPMLALARVNPMRNLHAWGAWWWLDEWVLEGLAMVLVGMPALAFVAELGLALGRRRWRQAGGLIALSLLAALLAAGLLLGTDRSDTVSGAAYSLQGWYWIWLVGAYLAGIVSLLTGLGRAWRRSASRSIIAPSVMNGRNEAAS